MDGKKRQDFTWQKISEKISLYTNGLVALLGENYQGEKVAFFTTNSLDMILFDLACLTSGIVNVMIPANSVDSHIEYILKLTKPKIIIVTGLEQLEKIKKLQSGLVFIESIIILSKYKPGEENIYTIAKLLNLERNVMIQDISSNYCNIQLEDLASIMFTSGTTGNPKGIMFSHKNIVFKRFARAMALPSIGEEDRFLAYLPLFHTFGRWLEMTGSIFWNAQYIFMENPSPETMIENMQRTKPSIFISIPKKWYQLYEQIGQEVDIIKGSDSEIEETVQRITGGNLKWGLSAAGHLDSEIFQFFQRYGIELMSGFGMTEATGGITMTPPGQYRPNSLGKALPGIHLKIDDNGELLIKGDYVMMDYINPEKEEDKFRDGWLPTGDIMEIDEEGFIRIIDRKKEIYKNIKGETIAPQKIENYFREFEFIKHVFLVGDQRHFNTLLIYPDYNFKEIDFRAMHEREIRDYFSSVVVSVNRFLAPYERIVDFSIIDRDFDEGRNELTPKGTYRRKVVEKNFSSVIEPMYTHNFISIKTDNVELQIPNWFLRESGVTANEIFSDSNTLYLKNSPNSLKVMHNDGNLYLGDYRYKMTGTTLDLGVLLVNPLLWLGNEQLVTFIGNKIFNWRQSDENSADITFNSSIKSDEIKPDARIQLQNLFYKQDFSLKGIHIASLLLNSKIKDDITFALQYLESVCKDDKNEFTAVSKEFMRRAIQFSPVDIQRKAFSFLLKFLSAAEFESVITSLLDKDVYFLNPEIISDICARGLTDEQLEVLFNITRRYCKKNNPLYQQLLLLITNYGSKHPSRFKIIRYFLVDCELNYSNEEITGAANKAKIDLRNGLREWLGPTQQVAVDIETNNEYTWDDVIIFEEGIDERDEIHLRNAIKDSKFIREAIFIFSQGTLVRLDDIPLGGVWISFICHKKGKSAYRLTIQTRFQGSFEIVVVINHSLAEDEILEEIKWLIRAGTTIKGKKLVEEFGGYWSEYNLWTEEYIPGETVSNFIRRLSRRKDAASIERLRFQWPHFIWSGLATFVDFWLRTGKRLELNDPSPENIIIPHHDYQTGSRIFSIAALKKHKNIAQLILNLIERFIEDTENTYMILKDVGKYKYIFSAFLETLGEEKGIELLNECLLQLSQNVADQNTVKLMDELKSYIVNVQQSGFIPKKLYFAIKRYNRWFDLNRSATIEARAATLSEIYDTYELNLIEATFPETRTRFFANTVFFNARDFIKQGLNEIIKQQKKQVMDSVMLGQYISGIKKQVKVKKDESFFLTRLTYAHLKATDAADLISLEADGAMYTDLVVFCENYEGEIFQIRTPVNPKEITRLHQLFITNKLPVQFQIEHKYLIAVNERGHLIGGLFYSTLEKNAIHLEKIVVANHYRRKGISDGLLNEFFKRLKANNIRFVTTGFFRPEYFYRFGFKIERKYAGLVKNLEEDSSKVFINENI